MNESNTLFVDDYLSDFLDQKLKDFLSGMKSGIDDDSTLEDFKKSLNEIKSNLLKFDYDLGYQEARKEISGTQPFHKINWVTKQRFKITGNESFLYLKTNEFTPSPPIGWVDDEFLYFEVSVPYIDTQDGKSLAASTQLETANYEKNLIDYATFQEKEVETFIKRSLSIVEKKYNELMADKKLAQQFTEEFTKSIKSNLLEKQSTKVPESEQDLEDFIKKLRDGKNGE